MTAKYANTWEAEGVVDPSVSTKRVFYEISNLSLKLSEFKKITLDQEFSYSTINDGESSYTTAQNVIQSEQKSS